MTDRTYGETKNCAGCRHWSEMIARSVGGAPIEAMCISPSSLARCNYAFGSFTCTDWESGEFGAVDQSGGNPYAEQAEDDTAWMEDDEDDICLACNGSGEGMYDGSTCYKCHGRGVETVEQDDQP